MKYSIGDIFIEKEVPPGAADTRHWQFIIVRAYKDRTINMYRVKWLVIEAGKHRPVAARFTEDTITDMTQHNTGRWLHLPVGKKE